MGKILDIDRPQSKDCIASMIKQIHMGGLLNDKDQLPQYQPPGRLQNKLVNRWT